MPVSLLLGLAAFGVYWRTLAVSIVWGDSAELTAAAYCAGVPHPTGYPLYMLLGHALARLVPWGSPAYRMNLLSALAGALAVALLYPLLLRFTRSRAVSVAMTLTFAFIPLYWSHAVITEVYTLHILGMVAVLNCVLAWDRRGDRRWLWAAALGYGLCFTHHLMSVLLAPGLLLFALTSRQRRSFLAELRFTLPLFLLPFLLYLYVPLAAWRDTPMNWGDARTWENFLAHVTGRQYRHVMFALSSPQLAGNCREYARSLVEQFPVELLWLAPVGAWRLTRRRPRLGALALLIYLAQTIYALNYQISDVEVYYLPSHLMVALWIGCGLRACGASLGRLWRRLAVAPRQRRRLGQALGAALFALPLTWLATHWEASDRHDDWSALMYARAVLASLKPNTLLVSADDHFYFPLLYARFVENRRPDVTLLQAYDALLAGRLRLTTRLAARGLTVRMPDRPRPGATPTSLLQRVVADNIDHRPITVLAQPETLQLPWMAPVIAPYHQTDRSNLLTLELSRRPPALAAALPADATGAERPIRFGPRRQDGRIGAGLELLRCRVEPFERGDVPWLRLSYDWRLHNPDLAREARVWVLFTDAEGNYQRKSDGSAGFHNIHPLAYGAGRDGKPLPTLLRETYEIYVPPREWNEQWHMRVAVATGSQFLAAEKSGGAWVSMGEIPVVSGAGLGRRVVSRE